jgi:hypothetical protein
MSKSFEQILHKKAIQAQNNWMEMYLILFAIGEMQNQTPMWYYFILVWMTQIKKMAKSETK